MSSSTIDIGPFPAAWTRRHLLGLEELSAEEITLILDQAVMFKKAVADGHTRIPVLGGTTCVTLFFENSTRTRTSFSPGCPTTGRRYGRFLGGDQQPLQGGDVYRHRQEPGGHGR